MDIIIAILHNLSKYGPMTRSIAKKLLHSITGKSELERLCESGIYTFHQCQEVEYSLYHSNHEEIRRILVADKIKVKDALQIILRVKRIIPDQGLTFLSSMPKYLRRIITYNTTLSEVTKLKNVKFDEENEEHEDMLNRLWVYIMGDEKMLTDRYTEQWTEIGFQGKNPATDFRGMGILSLKNMIYLFEKSPDLGRKIFGQSAHPKYGYSFAIMAINFTGTSYELLRNSTLKGYMYNLIFDEYSLEHYQQFFVALFNEFSDFWIMKEPPNIMSFNEVKNEFMKTVNQRLVKGTW